MSKRKPFQIYLKGENKTQSVREFEYMGGKCKVTFNTGKTFHYNASNVRIVESALNEPKSRNAFDFLSQIAAEVGLNVESEEGNITNILLQRYSQIDFVSPESLLGAFISGKLQESTIRTVKSTQEIIYPFGFNKSQKLAVDRALTNQLSIIEGPPGTGKTQTILNIIANAVMRGQSVAVVSSNNSATKNVLEKLQKSKIDFIAAYLGNSANKTEFLQSQKPRPEMTNWQLASEDVEGLRKNLNKRRESLEKKLEQQVKLSELKQELSAIETEKGHFESSQKEKERRERPEDLQVLRKLKKSSDALDAWLLCEYSGHSSWLLTFIRHVFEMLRTGKSHQLLVRKLLSQYSNEFLVAEFQRHFYELKISELNRQISEIVNQLEGFEFASKMAEYAEISLQLFKFNLFNRYGAAKSKEYKEEDLWKKSESFIKDYPVILSTTYSLRSSLSHNIMYDYVIVDESSQVDLCTGALALSCAKNTVVVGDLKQLPHVVNSKMGEATDAIFDQYDLPEHYRYRSQSLLSALVGLFPQVSRTLLREHYRCHPKIIEFCNKKFYDNQLIILSEVREGREPLIVYKTVEGNHARNRVNQRQVDIIKNEIIHDQELNVSDGSLGVITPYRNQTNLLQKTFFGENVQADTVDKFQGQEKKVVVLSTVDNEISDFTDDANRLNVAVSRAVEQLIVILNEGDALKDRNIGDLVRYVEYNNFTVTQSKVCSVFDYLYRSYFERRNEVLRNTRRISNFDSENLMYDLIIRLLKERGTHKLGVAVHIPLKMIIRDVSLLNSDEERYAMNSLTHVDFLIFDILDKTPKCGIEVDGVSFHKEGTRQSQRDDMKNEIFRKYKLPLHRFRTDGSDERARLGEILDSITG